MGEREPYYLAADPGTHTGWAVWDKDGGFIRMGTTHGDNELRELLNTFSTIKIVIIEDFRLWKHKARDQAGSRMPAPKAIAILETYANIWKAKTILQPSNIKGNAENLTGVRTVDENGKKLPKDQTHVIDAYNHGEYYLIGQGIRRAPTKL